MLQFRKIEVYEDDYEPTRLPEPTAARPGSYEKIEIMRQRVLNDEWLHHPDDEPMACEIVISRRHSTPSRTKKECCVREYTLVRFRGAVVSLAVGGVAE